MNNKFKPNYLRIGAAMLGLATAFGPVALLVTPAQSEPHAFRYERRKLEAGTVIVVKLNDALNSRESRKGDTFTGTVTLRDNDDPTALPLGTKVDGVVRDAKRKEGDRPGSLDLAFTRVTLPDGHSYDIDGSPIALDNKSVERSNGVLVAKKSNNGPSRLTYVGIGAGTGLLVNILSGGRGTLFSTLLGGGLGYGAGALVKNGKSNRDVDLKVGSKLGFRLDRNLVMGRNEDRDRDHHSDEGDHSSDSGYRTRE